LIYNTTDKSDCDLIFVDLYFCYFASMSEKHQLSTSRLEAFCDGVFAIAITLLILEVKIPSHDDIEHYGGLYNFLYHIWPSFFAYIFSFVIIGIYWANHHYFISMYKKTDHVFNMLHVLFLMCIAFLPYPTALLGDLISDETQRSSVVTFYSLGIWLPSIFWFISWQYGKKSLMDPRLDPAFISKLTKLYLLSNALYCFAFIISFFNSYISLSINIILTLLYLFPPQKPVYIKE
jgi:uncharacterized membrane protein